MRQTLPSPDATWAALFILALSIPVGSAAVACYYPNGNSASTYQPCNNTADGSPSACCELSTSVCSLTGYCYGSAGVMYRGGCTDSLFSAVQCPQHCKDVNSNSFSNINLCPGGSSNGFFTCSGSGLFTSDMCKTNFTFNAGVPFSPSSATAIQSTTTITTTATPSTSSTSSAQASSSTAQGTCSNPALTVGLAVGLPLGLLAAFLAAVVYWQHRKYTSTGSGLPSSAMSGPSAQHQGYPASPYTSTTQGTVYGSGMSPQQYPQYHPQQQEPWKPQPQPPAELQSTDQRVELQEG